MRGRGLCLAFDVPNDDIYGTNPNIFVAELKKRGINVPVCGAYTVRSRPCLYFNEKHVDVYADIMRKTIFDIDAVGLEGKTLDEKMTLTF